MAGTTRCPLPLYLASIPMAKSTNSRNRSRAWKYYLRSPGILNHNFTPSAPSHCPSNASSLLAPETPVSRGLVGSGTTLSFSDGCRNRGTSYSIWDRKKQDAPGIPRPHSSSGRRKGCVTSDPSSQAEGSGPTRKREEAVQGAGMVGRFQAQGAAESDASVRLRVRSHVPGMIRDRAQADEAGIRKAKP